MQQINNAMHEKLSEARCKLQLGEAPFLTSFPSVPRTRIPAPRQSMERGISRGVASKSVK
jgi:hypothetical protein